MIGYQAQEHYFNLFVTPDDIEKISIGAINGKLFSQFENNTILGLEARLSKNDEDKESITELTDSKGVIFKLDLKLGRDKYAHLKERGQVNIQKDDSEIALCDTSKICGWALDTYKSLQQRT